MVMNLTFTDFNIYIFLFKYIKLKAESLVDVVAI